MKKMTGNSKHKVLNDDSFNKKSGDGNMFFFNALFFIHCFDPLLRQQQRKSS